MIIKYHQTIKHEIKEVDFKSMKITSTAFRNNELIPDKLYLRRAKSESGIEYRPASRTSKKSGYHCG